MWLLLCSFSWLFSCWWVVVGGVDFTLNSPGTCGKKASIRFIHVISCLTFARKRNSPRVSPTSETKIRDCSFAQNYAQMILAYWATATNGKGTPRQWVSPGVPSACQHRQASFTAKNIIVLCFFRWTCADSTEQNHSFPFSDSTLTTTIMSSNAPPTTTSPDRPSTNNPQDLLITPNRSIPVLFKSNEQQRITLATMFIVLLLS